MHCSLLLILFAISCCAQEHLTCMRTSDTLSRLTTSETPQTRGLQGQPGKKGPAGPKGSTGLKGANGDRGFKGEPGVVDNAEVDRLRDRVAALELELRTTISALHSGHANLGGGWITPYNGYQYKRTASTANWQSSRSMCQAMGADLAVHGMQDSRVRLTIVNAISSERWIWIGLTDVEEEGRWMWIDGTPLTDELAANLWRSGEPNNVGSHEDCACVQEIIAQCVDLPCSWDSGYAICEKDWSP